MVKYDQKVIQSLAEGLYANASRIILTSVVLGIIAGGMLGVFGGASGIESVLNAIIERIPEDAQRAVQPFTHYIGLAACIAIGGKLGLTLGKQKAFLLKLQAQLALCFTQIEANTAEPATRTVDASDTSPASEN